MTVMNRSLAALCAATALSLAGPSAAAVTTWLDCDIDRDDKSGFFSFSLVHHDNGEWSVMSRFGPNAARALVAADAEGVPQVFALYYYPDRYEGLLSLFDDGRFIMTLHDRYRTETPEARTGTGHCTTADT